MMTERMLADARVAHGLRYVALRYFNVAGCCAALRGIDRAAAPGTLLVTTFIAAPQLNFRIRSLRCFWLHRFVQCFE